METDDYYWVWTISISMRAYARDMGIPLIDITVKSGIKAFAPTWENLMLYRQGLMSNEEYALAYYEKVLQTFRVDQREWENLESNKNIAFACYCKPGNFCHRYLFAPLYINYLQSKGHKVLFQGELTPHFRNLHFYENNHDWHSN